MTNTNTTSSNRLSNIVTAQAKTRARDFLFAAFVVLATVIGVTGVQSASQAAHVDVAQVAQR